jgi:hypothetical protein
MSLPNLTPEQRAQALQKAALVRRERHEVKDRIKRGTLTLAEVIGTEGDTIGKMKISALLTAVPGVGKVKAAQIMERHGIAEGRTVRGLGRNQRAALEQEFSVGAA